MSEARACLKKEDEVGVLDALVVAWQASADPKLAGLIDVWLERVAATRAPIGEATSSMQKAWRDRAADEHTADLPWLISALPNTTTTLAKERLDVLARWKPNPVLARLLMAWVRKAPFRILTRTEMMTPVMKLLVAQADPRFRQPLATAAGAERSATLAQVGRTNGPQLDALATAARRWKVKAAVPAATLKTLAAPAATKVSIDRGDVDALLRAVYAHPQDLARRQVLADALQEKGDPRGELIALQIEREQRQGPVSKRERELLAKYSDTWLGRLSTMTRHPRFRAGFLSHAVARGGKALSEGAEEWEEWSTVESVDCRTQHTRVSARLISSKAMVSLRNVGWVTVEAVAEAARARGSLPWTHLSLVIGYEGRVDLDLLAHCPLPALRSLDLVGPFSELELEDALVLLESPLGRRLEQLSFAMGSYKGIPKLFQRALASRLKQLACRSFGATYTLDLVQRIATVPMKGFTLEGIDVKVG